MVGDSENSAGCFKKKGGGAWFQWGLRIQSSNPTFKSALARQPLDSAPASFNGTLQLNVTLSEPCANTGETSCNSQDGNAAIEPTLGMISRRLLSNGGHTPRGS